MTDYKKNIIEELVRNGEIFGKRKTNKIRYFVYLPDADMFLGRRSSDFFLTKEPIETFSHPQCVARLFLTEHKKHYLQLFDWVLIEA